MKKRKLYISIGLNIVLTIILIYSLIPNEPELADLSVYTQQNIDKAFEINHGMNHEQVIKIMGKPAVREFDKELEEWHYCKTGNNVDEYVVIKLNKNKVVALNNYTVTWLDIVYHHTKAPTEATIEVGGMGDCKLTARWGTYNNAPNKSVKQTD
ncbi:MAG: outer membrane protein assembly factor BamE [Gammaproteobacteria bacterium]|nr:outer membrane protein assembly factor BamE [Gammaproteobacteria bacterium]